MPYKLHFVQDYARRGAGYFLVINARIRGMDKPKNIEFPPTARVIVSLHQLYVEIEHEAVYPDQITDMSSRAYELFMNAMEGAKKSGMDIRKTPDYEFDEEDEE
jgi:hypothetical protein